MTRTLDCVSGRVDGMVPLMDSYLCHPVTTALDASVELPGSKSITNRALVAAALADGDSLLTNILLADDTRLMIDALGKLGVAVTLDEAGPHAEITGCAGQFPASETTLLCGNAGTVIRFLAAAVATGFGEFTLDGVERMRRRPLGDLMAALQALGAQVEYLEGEGYAPIVIHARHLRGGQVAFTAPESSQFISALLLAGPYASGDILIEVAAALSVPYLKMTTSIMDAFGVSVIEQYDASRVKFVVPAPQRYAGRTFAVEPDASNATYFLAAAAVAGGSVTVRNLGTQSVQGDARFVDVLERMGCAVMRDENRLTVVRSGQALHGIEVDLNDMPDTVQTLAVVALFADGPTTIRNVANLRVKETDRLAALAKELAKLGARVQERPDGLTIEPPERIAPATIHTYGDHRMAMSFALAGLRSPGVTIDAPACCGKTFPDFFDRWDRLRAETAS
jgi:3-phosphoshikimate 1-carboxyvinyltransferase